MEKIKKLFVTGYRSFELGVFQENDPKIKIIKKMIRKELLDYIENGLEWIIIGGNLGIEIWTGELVLELKKEYPEMKLGIIYPFKEFSDNWNEVNRMRLEKLEQEADYVNAVSHKAYFSPSQLQAHTIFILQHSTASLVVYDQEYPGKTFFFLRIADDFSQKNRYEIRMITMEDLQNSIE